MTTILTHINRVRGILALLLFLSSASLWAQSDDATLINITTLTRLDAIHYDLNGDGMVDASASMADSISYETAFGLARKGSITCTGGCSGYELRNNLDFEDADGNGTADDKSIWAEGASTAGVSGAVAEGWAPIGGTFTATFDGRGHTISNLYINRPSTNNVSLFGVLGTGGNVRNLGIEGGSVTGAKYVGGLVGYNLGTISACYATGDASGSGSVGGLVGWSNATISACYATGNATGNGQQTGGLVGDNRGTIRACYATGNASGAENVGGLVGFSDSTIRACYATGNANGGSNVGGLVGFNFGTVTKSYFDRTVSNRPASDRYDKTTAQLQTPTAYTGIYSNWNIDVDNGQPIGVDNGTAAGDPGTDNPWDFGSDSEYPALKVDFNVDGTPSAAEFGTQRHTASLGVFSFTPERGVVGATVTIRGRLFSTTATDNTVTFIGAEGDADNAAAMVSTSPAATTTELTVTVPPNAQTGPISVMVGAAADTSSQDFTVWIPEDKDANDNGLIEVSSLEQLDAIRYDLDGNGVPSGTELEQAAYRTAFGLSGGATIVSCTGGCEGYELINNLDFEDADGDGTADDKSIWAEGATAAGVSGAVADGWVLISGRFTATFEGNNYTISNLYINRSSADNVGLFRALGAGGNVRNLGIEGGSVRGRNRVGGLVGENVGGTISDCHAIVDVTAFNNDVGGLVGENEGGTITNSYATGYVRGSGLTTGGLVGWNNGGTISACYATGNVRGSGNNVGGLVGANEGGAIRACYATGNANGGGSVGGLAGANKKKGTTNATISACYAAGTVRGTANNVGGLVGSNSGTISACYATRAASGASNVGGLVGSNSGTITNSYFDSTVSSALATTPIGGGTTTGSDVTNVSGKTTADLQMPMAYGTAMDIYSLWNIDVDDGLAVGVDDGTAAGDATADDPWDFGTSGQYPALKVDFDGNGTATADEFGPQRTTRFLATRYMADIELGISAGSEIGTVAAVPADFNNTLSYTILSQTLNGAAVSYFLIANTASGGTNVGTISVADPAPTEPGIYTLSVEVSDGAGGTATTEVIINLYLLLLMSGGEFTACSGKFTDTGGESGNYGNNEDITMTISPESAADRVRVEFTSFQVEAEANCIYDKLEVYNGATTSAPLIDFYCGTNSLGVVLVVLSSSAGGKLTFRFKSDGDTNFFGWEATISCVPAVPAAPPAAPTALTATVADAEVTLSWDAPVNDGGAVITGYMIEYDTDMNFSSPPTTVSTMDHATSYTVSGLANGTLYYFRVAAVNSAGTGASGTAVSATPATNLIDVTTLEQLDAIRYDLDGNGTPSGTTAEQAAYRTAFGLTGMNNNTCTGDCGGYELRNNLDFAGTKWENPTGGTFTGTHETGGWTPLGYYNSPTDFADYTATFDGRDHTISNLYINRPSTSNVGLFGDLVGNVRNLGIEGGSLTGHNFVGGLSGV